MRAVFTVDLPTNDEGKYPTDLELIQLLRTFGWEPIEVCQTEGEDHKLQKCRELSEVLFRDMPENSASRTEHVIFFGYLADDYTRFVVLKLVEGQVTFRLENTELSRLQTSAGKVIRKVIHARLYGKPLHVSNQSVVVYERGNDYLLFNGRVIPNALEETLRSDRKSLLLTIIPLLIFIVISATVMLGVSAQNFGFVGGTLERLSTALITTALVSGLSLLETYLEIYRNRIIVW